VRLATYTQPSMAPRGSFFALFVLALTVILGTSALHSLMLHFAPQLHSAIALLWLVTYLIAFMGLMFGHGINWISWLSRYRILLVILLLGTIISVTWSMDAAISAERVVHLIGCSVLAIYLGFMIPLLTTLRVTAVVMGVIMIASLAAATLMPPVGMENYEGVMVWRGILNSKNALGFWASIAVLLYITLSASTQSFFLKIMCYLLAAISFFVLVKSDSATSLLAMLVAGSLSLYLYIAFRFQLGFVRMVVLAILFGGLLGFALVNIDTAQIVGRSGDFTGRGEVWRQTWKLIMAKPLTGYGYGAIWFPNDATLWIQQSLTDFTWLVHHAHNGFLNVASEIGLPLSCVALLMVAQQLIEIFYCQYERQQVGVLFVLAFVVAYLISNFSEARFLVNRELYWIFFLALPISMLRQINLKSIEVSDDYATDGYDEEATGAARYANAPIGKPWLRPMAQKEAALIGAAGTAAEGPQFDDDTLNNTLSNRTIDDINDLPRLGFHDETDINLGDGDLSVDQSAELDERKLADSDDKPLDKTQEELDDLDSTQEIAHDSENEAPLFAQSQVKQSQEKSLDESLDRSLDELLDESHDQSLDDSLAGSHDQSTDESLDRSLDELLDESHDQSLDDSLAGSHDQSKDESLDRSLDELLDESRDQSQNEPQSAALNDATEPSKNQSAEALPEYTYGQSYDQSYDDFPDELRADLGTINDDPADRYKLDDTDIDDDRYDKTFMDRVDDEEDDEEEWIDIPLG